jgi:hypothetical protein
MHQVLRSCKPEITTTQTIANATCEVQDETSNEIAALAADLASSGRSSASSERRAPSLCRFDRLKSDINEKPMTSNLLDAVDYVVPQTGLFGETNVEADDEVVVVVRQAEER